MALAARANLLCLSIVVGSEDSVYHALGQEGAGASAQGPSAGVDSGAAGSMLGKPPGGGLTRTLVFHGHFTLEMITTES